MGTLAASSLPEPGRSVHLMLSEARPGRGEPSVEVVGEWAIGQRCDDGSSALGRADSWVVAFNGRIDAIAGATGRPDADDVARMLAAGGADAVGLLRGDFALIASDGHRLIAARDHLGTEPLFAGSRHGATVVAGQPKQVTAGLGISRRMNLDAVLDLFYGRTEPDAEIPCVVEGVERIPRASVVTFERSRASTTRIWRLPEPGSADITAEEAATEFRRLGRLAVERTLGPAVAIALSGGIDSTAIAGFSAGHDPAPMAISAVYPHAPTVDERPYIELMALHADLDLVTYVPEYRQHEYTARWVDVCDTPLFGPSLPAIAELFEVGARHGRTDVLSGEMAELAFDLREHALGQLILDRHWATAARQWSAFRSMGAGSGALTRGVAASLIPGRLGMAYHRRSTPDDGGMPAWLDASMFSGIGHRWDFTKPVGRRWKDLQTYFAGGASFPGLEMATMCGHEMGSRLRRPLVDRDLWEFLITLPAHIKFPEAATKSMVRSAMRGLVPDAILDRTDKTVFGEDVLGRAPYDRLQATLDDAEFRLPGIRYDHLLTALAGRTMTQWELELSGTLASIHQFARVSP